MRGSTNTLEFVSKLEQAIIKSGQTSGIQAVMQHMMIDNAISCTLSA